MSIKEVLNRAKREKKKARALDTAKKVGTGLGIGAAIGSIFGVLFAPKSGKETRKDIADTAKNSVESIKEGASEVGEKISKVVEEGKEKIANIKKTHVAKDQAAAEEDECCKECEEANDKTHNCCED